MFYLVGFFNHPVSLTKLCRQHAHCLFLTFFFWLFLLVGVEYSLPRQLELEVQTRKAQSIQLIIWRNFDKIFAFSIEVHLLRLPSFGIVLGPEFSTPSLYNNVLLVASCTSVYYRAISCWQTYRCVPLNQFPWTLSKALFSNRKSPIIGEGEQTLPRTFLAN